MDTEKAEMQNRIEDMEYDLNKTRSRCEKVETHLAETCQKLKAMQDDGGGGVGNKGTGNGVPGKITPAITSKKVSAGRPFPCGVFIYIFGDIRVFWH